MRSLALFSLALGILLLPLGGEALSQSRTPREIQQALADRGYAVGTVDGVWGRRSIAALKAFQTSEGLPTTGVVDETTLKALVAPPQRSAGDTAATSESSPPSFGVAPKVDRASLPPIQGSTANKTIPTNEALPATEIKQNSDDVEHVGDLTPAVDPSTPSTSASGNILPPPRADGNEPSRSRGNKAASTFGKVAFWGGVILLVVVWRRGRKKRVASPKAIQPSTMPYVEISTTNPRPFVQHKHSVAASAETDNDTLVEIIAPRTLSPESGTAIKKPGPLATHNELVNDWVTRNSVKDDRRPAMPHTRGSSVWVAPESPITVGPFTITKGLIYVGSSLPKQGGWSDQENCLIDPRQKVAKSGDPSGETMGYWPSYAQLTPSARYSYLEWLAGDRSNPETYIGYIFLYFYGLERRLMLEPLASGNAEVVSEVQRLLEIYGYNGSFNRYASELLSAQELRSGEQSPSLIASLQRNGYEVPTAIKIAIGVRVRDKRPIEPDLLLRFVLTHPETRVRTPAKRAPEILRTLFIAAAEERYPDGYVMKPGRVKALKKRYRACSGTFEVDVDVLGGAIPDVTDRSEPINTARKIFDKCTDELEEFSRAVGRLPGLKPNLSAISKLPSSLRRGEAENLAGSPVTVLDNIAKQQAFATVAQIASVTGVSLGDAPTKGKLREIAQLCASFNLGVTFDPAFAFKVAAADDKAILFPLQSDQVGEATSRFRQLQLSLMLGMVVGFADGDFHENERNAILEKISQAVGLTEDDRLRLIAEVRLSETNPERLEDWMKRLKDVPSDAREAIADELIVMATADGELHAEEIRKLETIFRRMGLPTDDLYDRLHGSSRILKDTNDAAVSNGVNPGATSQRIDLSRLKSIRSETLVTSSVLADIFTEEEDDVSVAADQIPSDATSSSELFDGLEQRFGLLLSELVARQSWSAADFEHLVRDAGLMPGAAKEAINEWALDRFDDLLIEGDDPVGINMHLLTSTSVTQSEQVKESLSA
ncbi:TerB N-terminal domain-containing protein [Agrobacterium tumefaciens]|uniref:TerB N-terminal domain-containing protein n=1 Tax=Agrobacterium tumefaciens TaxID=358 RepID=UPI00287C74C1|nr:TerB N-terminal domain-containing protein [Agrobacterium tumefaciens]MDS7595485.1 TerB N-terminal domain-containing protein [Agrobacterium tumefaciens]